jgi:C4-type Zn-finger protein
MSTGTASRFHGLLELVGGITLATALGAALMVQLDVWRAVRSNGNDDEHNDFKIRTARRRWDKMKQELEEQATIIVKLEEAYTALQSEKADVKAMHDHDLRGQTQAVVTENPLNEG